MYSIYTTPLRIIIVFFLSLTLISCSKTIEKPEDRAIDRWQALIDKNWEKAYSFESPGFRKSYNLEQFRSQFGSAVTWKSIKLVKTEAKENVAKITVELMSIFSEPGSGDMLLPSMFSEKWLFIDDQWWHIKNN